MWWKKRKPVSVDRDKVQEYLDQQADQARVFARFICEAVRRKYPITLKIEVDAVECSTGVLLPGGEMLEYLANWACAQQIIKIMTAEGFNKPAIEGTGDFGRPLTDEERERYFGKGTRFGDKGLEQIPD